MYLKQIEITENRLQHLAKWTKRDLILLVGDLENIIKGHEQSKTVLKNDVVYTTSDYAIVVDSKSSEIAIFADMQKTDSHVTGNTLFVKPKIGGSLANY